MEQMVIMQLPEDTVPPHADANDDNVPPCVDGNNAIEQEHYKRTVLLTSHRKCLQRAMEGANGKGDHLVSLLYGLSRKP